MTEFSWEDRLQVCGEDKEPLTATALKEDNADDVKPPIQSDKDIITAKISKKTTFLIIMSAILSLISFLREWIPMIIQIIETNT